MFVTYKRSRRYLQYSSGRFRGGAIHTVTGVARVLSGGALFPPKTDDLKSFKTQAKTTCTKLSAAHQRCALKFDFLLYLGVHLPARECTYLSGVHLKPWSVMLYDRSMIVRRTLLFCICAYLLID